MDEKRDEMKNITRLFLLFIGLISVINAEAQDIYQTWIKEGNRQYEAQQYDSALLSYDAVLKAGFFNDELYYNLGNTNFKLGNIQWASYYWEKTLLLNPNHANAQYNLDLLQSSIQQLPENVAKTYSNKIKHALPLSTWTLLSVFGVIFIGVGILLLIGFIIPKYKRYGIIAGSVGTLLLAFSLTTGLSLKKDALASTSAIVFENSVPIYNEPSSGSTRIVVVHQGLKVNTLQKEGNWYNVELPNGEQGWINANHVKPLVAKPL